MKSGSAAVWLAANEVDPRRLAERAVRQHRGVLGDVDADDVVDLVVDEYERQGSKVEHPAAWIRQVVARRVADVLRRRAHVPMSRPLPSRASNLNELRAFILYVEIPATAPWLVGEPCGVGRAEILNGAPDDVRRLERARGLVGDRPELVAAIDDEIAAATMVFIIGADDSLRDCIFRCGPLASHLGRPLTPRELARAVVWFGFWPPRWTDPRVRHERPTAKNLLRDVERDVRSYLQSAARRNLPLPGLQSRND